MNILIREIDEQNLQFVDRFDDTFIVSSKLILRAENNGIRYEVVSVPPYEKKYPHNEVDPRAWLNHPDQTIFFAYADDQPAGQIFLKKYWNGYAYVEDLAVDVSYRRQGLGRALIQRAIAWAREKNLPGVMLETQDNNAAACRLYENCGFELGGFDRFLYRGLHPPSDEIALYWYYFIERD